MQTYFPRISRTRLQYAKQHSTIIGYSNVHFTKAQANIQDIAYVLITSFPDGKMDPWVPDIPSDTHGSSIVSNCRYFTMGRNVHIDTKIDFAKYVDPAGVLGKFLGDGVSHCMDNDVAYLELKNNKSILSSYSIVG